MKRLCGLMLGCLLLISALAQAEEAFSPSFWQGIDGSTALIPLSEALFEHFTGQEAVYQSDEGIKRHVQHNTTSEAYAAISQSESPTRLIFVTPPSAEEITRASLYGVELELIPIARDALVMLGNRQNPVTGLTHAQLQDIYQGRIVSWQEVGGEDVPIVAYQRSLFSGSQTLFLSLVMEGQALMDPLVDTRLSSMDFLIDAVASYQNGDSALGYSMFYYVNDMYGSYRLRMLAVDGVVPSRETIASGEYPFSTCYYAVIRKELPQDAPERALIDFILSEAGQRIVQEAGYVPLHPLEEVSSR